VAALAAASPAQLQAGAARGRPQVVLVTADCTTGSFLCAPFLHALRRSGLTGQVISPDAREDPVGTLSLLAARDPELVIVDILHAEALATVARRFPRTRFALFDGRRQWVPGLPSNVQAVILLPTGAAYLAGWLAARLEQRRPGRDVIGAVGGEPVPGVEDFITGYRAGARHADPSIEVLVGYSHDFTDANKCVAIARDQIARGAGVVFDVAGVCGLGVLQAAKQADVWGIGVDGDQSSLGPQILTSVVKDYEVGFSRLLEQVRTGTLRTGGTSVLTVRNGGAGLATISPKVPPEIRAGLDRLRARIVAGRLSVPS
jgi:basic membrane protein A